MGGLFSNLRQFNWVDIFALILLIRIGYISLKTGFAVEIFKILGAFFACYLSLHYYPNLAVTMSAHFKRLPPDFFNLLFAAILMVFWYLIFVLLRTIFYRVIKLEAEAYLDKWGGLILGLARGFLAVSLVFFVLVLSHFNYLEKSVKGSYSGKFFLKVAPSIYSGVWNNLTSKFMLKEKFNSSVRDILKNS